MQVKMALQNRFQVKYTMMTYILKVVHVFVLRSINVDSWIEPVFWRTFKLK